MASGFPQTLVDAVLHASVCVVVAPETYFSRWYCLRELELTLAPYLERLRVGTDPQDAEQALARAVVLPADAGVPSGVGRLPPRLRTT